MIETLGSIVLWLIGGCLLFGGGLLWLVDIEASRVMGEKRSRFPKVMVALGGALVILMLTGCAGTAVLATPNSCAVLIPSSWKDGVAGADLPADDTVGSWVAFGDAQTGKLDQANGRTKDSLEIISKCEQRDAAAVKRATRKWWQVFG